MAIEEKEEEEEFRRQTRRTTVNMHMETGVRIPMSSSPSASRMLLLGLCWFRSISLEDERAFLRFR